MEKEKSKCTNQIMRVRLEKSHKNVKKQESREFYLRAAKNGGDLPEVTLDEEDA